MPRTQIATPDLTALFSGGVAPPSFELRENRCETTDMADDRAPYVQSSGFGGTYATAGLGVVEVAKNTFFAIGRFPTNSYDGGLFLICMNVAFLGLLLWN